MFPWCATVAIAIFPPVCSPGNAGRRLAVLLVVFLLAGQSGLSWAVSHVVLQVGEIRHPAGVVQNLHATLDAEGAWRGTALLKKGDLAQWARQQPLPVSVGQGVMEGKLAFAGQNETPRQIRAELALRDMTFSDSDGLHAGDKIGARLMLEAHRAGARWHWDGALRWDAGEVFWQPWYFSSPLLDLRGRGWLSDDALAVESGEVSMAGVGAATVAGRWRRHDRQLETLEVAALDLDTGAAYPVLLKPLLEKTVLGNLEMAGRADVRLKLAGGRLSAFDVTLREFDVEDRDGRFGFYKARVHIPWVSDRPQPVAVDFAGGHLMRLPLGAARLAATVDGYTLAAPQLGLPLLGGMLTLKDVSAVFMQRRWHWRLGASLTPVSLPEFTHAVGWPGMQGQISAVVPMATYSNGRMVVDGVTQFQVFDGTAAIANLVWQDPLGVTSRLQADIRLRDLDLDLLTRTFSFGSMSGRLDGDVRGLELSRWQPVQFDAVFRSSPGSYKKKISQRAVENISALGGAGASAAIQRSFLRFFKEFNYAGIGLSCRLRNGVCTMDGMEPAQSGYVLVKGSGIPAITVLGYNRNVSWSELLQRVRRITQGNASPIIR